MKLSPNPRETAVTIEPFRGAGENLERINAQAKADQRKAKPNPADDAFRRSLPLGQRIIFGVGRLIFRWWWNSGDGKEAEEEKLFREGKFKLVFVSKRNGGDSSSAPPSPKQEQAWAAIERRGDAVWDEVLARLVEEYRAQRPVRVRWWKAIYGDYLLDLALPDVADAAGMKKLIRPLWIRVKRGKKSLPHADVAVHFICTWNADGAGAVIRDGKLAGIEPVQQIYDFKVRPEPALHHPVFGALRRIPDDDPWEVVAKITPSNLGKPRKAHGPCPREGSVHLESFRDYYMAADDRSEFLFNRAKAPPPRSAIQWDFVRGNFDLRAYAPAGQEPTHRQAAAFAAFMADEAANAAAVVQAVFDDYRLNYDRLRQRWATRNGSASVSNIARALGTATIKPPEYADVIIPPPAGAEQLHERIQLRHVLVHPEDESGDVALGFQFVCTWPGDGVGVRWRDGKVEAVGRWDAAEPKESK